MTLWFIIIVAGVLTFGIRASMLFAGPNALPPSARDALRFVVPAVLAAIILPAVLYVGDRPAFDAGFGNERVPAALLACGVAWATRNTWLTIGMGMTALWLLQWWT